jgi:uncharacterized damage-inducible protein DinB
VADDGRESLWRAAVAKPLAWREAHATFDDAVADLAPELRGRRVDGFPHSAWELVEHVRFTQRDILDFCRDANYQEPHWPDDYWPKGAAPPSEAAWDESLAAYRADRDALRALAESGPDPHATIPPPRGTGQTYLREVLLVADHTSYHVGQLVMLRKLLGAWPSA